MEAAINKLSTSNRQSYYHATKDVEITSEIHLGALALAQTKVGYTIEPSSSRVAIKGIKRLMELGKVREWIFEGQIHYSIKH